jgi:hypothetical protein
VQAASSAIPAGRCKSAPVILVARLLAARPGMLVARLLAARPVILVARPPVARPGMLVARLPVARPGMLVTRLLGIRSPPACSASARTIRKPEPIWATMASAIPVHEPRC